MAKCDHSTAPAVISNDHTFNLYVLMMCLPDKVSKIWDRWFGSFCCCPNVVHHPIHIQNSQLWCAEISSYITTPEVAYILVLWTSVI